MFLNILGLLKSRYLYLSLSSSFTVIFSSIWKGGVSLSERTLKSSAIISTFPVFIFSFIFSAVLKATVPVTARTNSLLMLSAFLKISLSEFPSTTA